MKTEKQVLEGIETGKYYVIEDCNKLMSELKHENFISALETLKILNASVAAIIGACEILNHNHQS